MSRASRKRETAIPPVPALPDTSGLVKGDLAPAPGRARNGKRGSRSAVAVRFRDISLGCYVPGCGYTCENVKNPVNSLNSHFNYKIKKGDKRHRKALERWNAEKKKIEVRESEKEYLCDDRQGVGGTTDEKSFAANMVNPRTNDRIPMGEEVFVGNMVNPPIVDGINGEPFAGNMANPLIDDDTYDELFAWMTMQNPPINNPTIHTADEQTVLYPSWTGSVCGGYLSDSGAPDTLVNNRIVRTGYELPAEYKPSNLPSLPVGPMHAGRVLGNTVSDTLANEHAYTNLFDECIVLDPPQPAAVRTEGGLPAGGTPSPEVWRFRDDFEDGHGREREGSDDREML